MGPLAAHRAGALGIGLLSGGYGREELERSGRIPRVRRTGRNADPAGGGRRSAQPLTVGSDGGGCVAGAARVDHDCVRALPSETEALNLAQPGAMADASNVRHDTIVVPETMSPAQVRALAQRKAQAQVGDDDGVAFLHLHGSGPVGGEYGTEVEWRYSYQVIPPGGAATDTVG